MHHVPFGVEVFGELSDALDGTAHVEKRRISGLGAECVRQLDGLGENFDAFARNVTDASLVAALQQAVQKAKNMRIEFKKPVRLYDLIREVRNRCRRVRRGEDTPEDRRELVSFGKSIRTYKKATAAAA